MHNLIRTFSDNKYKILTTIGIIVFIYVIIRSINAYYEVQMQETYEQSQENR